ncbi:MULTISPECIES: hypothetical protein [unclassified Fusobacterium]|uniref:hypothetical protein n=2 Tax=unclassified Fusobacterium TaxID=2648384 RepID=UPI001B8CBAE4|nr:MULTISPECIES: hypothetical protein [unclassified Fusobacterium]MBR8701476.1 hypothetical protein [Fusobacterium sp. DD45]MBR8711956.1 hypothetical protein [Fusobacterium sp. DD28]MBR8752529.1 hypothetical protein [Fusobacterium sp. DD26]
MKEKIENILFNIFVYVAAACYTAYMLVILFIICLFIPIAGWAVIRYVYSPYFGYYTHYWEFIFLPLVGLPYFLLLISDKDK